jgi:UDP-N-acetylmuramate--alanine ligase
MDVIKHTHYYFIGIGGIGMSALARYLHHNGKTVAGYDKTATSLCKELEKEGVQIHYNDDFESIPAVFKDVETACVIYTPAIPVDFGELLRFRESKITLKKRAQLLGDISKTMTCLAVAGTHGKTTTSAILAHLLYKSNVKVTAFLGGILNTYNTNYLCTGTDVMVVEADEFDRSFMNLSPDIAGITSIDADHLDIYGDEKEFRKTFEDFARLVPYGNLLINEHVDLHGRLIGLEQGEYQATDIQIKDGAYEFTLKTPVVIEAGWMLKLPGRHNLSNAMLAIAMALENGASSALIKSALVTFPGVDRRFTYRIDTKELVLIDDYAHHPTEINAVYSAVREMYPDQEITAVFQPHLYSRTRDFEDEFVKSLARFDDLALLDIYPARELPIEGVSSQVLVEKINDITSRSNKAIVISKDQILSYLQNRKTRVVLMIGAGDIGVEIHKIVSHLKQEQL